VDKENRRISLSLRQNQEPAPDSGAALASEEPAKPRKKRKKPLRGGLASHFEW
jgi:hypothetical protein